MEHDVAIGKLIGAIASRAEEAINENIKFKKYIYQLEKSIQKIGLATSSPLNTDDKAIISEIIEILNGSMKCRPWGLGNNEIL